MTTQYEKLKSALRTKAGRPPLSAEEKQRRKEAQKQEARRRTEARRRALIVLQYKYSDEFKAAFDEEYSNLASDARFITK